MKSWLVGKGSDPGRDWGQEEKGTTEDEMAGWHHWLNGCESEWTLGVGDGQGSLACSNSWGHRVGHDWVTELNWSIYKWMDVVSKPRTIALFFCLYTSWISHILNNAYIPRINPSCSMFMILLMWYWILFASVLLRTFAFMFFSDICDLCLILVSR